MRKFSLSEWSSLAEIVGTIAVVISLIFVVRSLDTNTYELRDAKTHYLAIAFDDLLAEVANNPELAVSVAKLKYGIELDDGVSAQIFWLQRREIGLWEDAYYWQQEGQLPDETWTYWNDYYVKYIPESFPESWWKSVRHAFGPGFADYVDAAYARN